MLLMRSTDLDHIERTRHSFILDGRELGYVRPTRETEAKLRPDPIVRLVANGTLSRARGDAAMEIRDIFEHLVAGLWSRAIDVSASKGGGGGPSDRIATLHAGRYLPWAFYLGGGPAAAPIKGRPGKPSKPGRCPRALEMSIAVIIDGATLSECDARHHRREGTAAKLLTYALAVYADIAGWEQNRGEIQAFETGWQGSRRPALTNRQPAAR
jgi:hypothetical protein